MKLKAHPNQDKLNYNFINYKRMDCIIFRLAGLFPGHQDKNKSILWTIYSVILEILFILILIRSLEEERLKFVPTDITSLVGTVQDLMMVLTECFWILGAIYYKGLLFKIKKEVTNIKISSPDNELKMKNSWKKIFLIEILTMGVLIVFRSAVYVDISPYSGLWLSVSTLLADILIAAGTLQFCNFNIMLYQKFKFINEELKILKETGMCNYSI